MLTAADQRRRGDLATFFALGQNYDCSEQDCTQTYRVSNSCMVPLAGRCPHEPFGNEDRRQYFQRLWGMHDERQRLRAYLSISDTEQQA